MLDFDSLLERGRARLAARARANTGLGPELRIARRRAGITQADIAATLRVNVSAVCLWESGKRVPSAIHSEQLAVILDRLRVATGPQQ